MNKVMSRRLDKCAAFSSFAKYMVAGGAGFIVDYSILTLCYVLLSYHYLISAALGFVAGLVFVYISSNKWVFAHRRLKDNVAMEFLVFALIGLIGLLLTVLFMWVFVDVIGVYPLVAKLITTALVLMWNFGARKMILYS